MEITPAQRLKQFLEYSNMPFDAFVKAINATKLIGAADKYSGDGEKSTIRKKEYKDKFSVVNLNYNWYLTGEGDMLVNTVQENAGEVTKTKMVQIPPLLTLSLSDMIEVRDEMKQKIEVIEKVLEAAGVEK